jgi:hypothetical protein
METRRLLCLGLRRNRQCRSERQGKDPDSFRHANLVAIASGSPAQSGFDEGRRTTLGAEKETASSACQATSMDGGLNGESSERSGTADW